MSGTVQLIRKIIPDIITSHLHKMRLCLPTEEVELSGNEVDIITVVFDPSAVVTNKINNKTTHLKKNKSQ